MNPIKYVRPSISLMLFTALTAAFFINLIDSRIYVAAASIAITYFFKERSKEKRAGLKATLNSWVQGILAIASTGAVIGGVFVGKIDPAWFAGIAALAIGWYFIDHTITNTPATTSSPPPPTSQTQ